jgi:hypothetical protein
MSESKIPALGLWKRVNTSNRGIIILVSELPYLRMSDPTTMDIRTKSNTNRKRARDNTQKISFQQPSALQDAQFAASLLLASLPATIKSLAESLLDKFLKF